MKKTEMLKKNYEFKNIISKGNYYSGKYIEAFIKKNNKNSNFLGIAISKKVAKAVGRNKIKRLIRENYNILELDIKDGYSIVFLWKKKIEFEKATFVNIKNDMKFILKKAHLNMENRT